MATGIGNPLGAIQVGDAGAPRVVSAYARAVISGGCFVAGSTAQNVVTSGTSSFVTEDLQVVGDASGNTCNGVALVSTTSGAVAPVATNGLFIFLADGTVNSGYPVMVGGVNAVHNVTTGSVAMTEYPIGRAWTDAASGGFCVVQLNLG